LLIWSENNSVFYINYGSSIENCTLPSKQEIDGGQGGEQETGKRKGERWVREEKEDRGGERDREREGNTEGEGDQVRSRVQ
jgi:hypothetical protein